MNLNIQPGNPYLLGATWNGEGINFCLYADIATEVELCLFNAPGDKTESHRIKKNKKDSHSFSTTDSAPFMPKCVVVDDAFNWEDDKHPKTKYHDTVIYELHVKGFTQLHPFIPDNIKGTYNAIAHPEAIKHYKS